MIYSDQKQVVKDINSGLKKILQGAGEGVSSICEIISLLEKITILVLIKHTEGYPKVMRSFKENPAALLIIDCHR